MKWPITFEGWWEDGDRDDPGIDGPWETFTVMVSGREAGDMRELLPADVPLLLEALGGERKWLCDYPEFNDEACVVDHDPSVTRMPRKHTDCGYALVVPLEETT